MISKFHNFQVAAEPYIHQEPIAVAAPVAVAAPAVAYNYAPVAAPVAAPAIAYNYAPVAHAAAPVAAYNYAAVAPGWCWSSENNNYLGQNQIGGF